MSFGYSGSDFILLLQLARKSYKNCAKAGAEYREIALEIKALYSILKPLHEEAQKSHYSLFKRDRHSAKELFAATNGCQNVLHDVQTMLAKYEGLSIDSEAVGTARKLWHRFRFGSKIEELGDLRAKLITYTSTISVALDTLQLRATNRLEGKFDDMKKDFDCMRRVIFKTTVKSRVTQRGGSTLSLLSLSTYAEDDKEVWHEFRRVLLAKGFRSEHLNKHKALIEAYMLRLKQSGVLDSVQTFQSAEARFSNSQQHESPKIAESLPNMKSDEDFESSEPLLRRHYEETTDPQTYLLPKNAKNRLHHDEIVTQVLLKSGVDVFATNFDINKTFLPVTSEDKEKTVIDLFLRIAANTNIGNTMRLTCLQHASMKGNAAAVQVLLENGADTDTKCGMGWTALHLAIIGASSHNLSVFLRSRKQELLEGKESFEINSNDNISQLHSDVVQLLLDSGIEIDAKDAFGHTALYSAVLFGQKDLMQLLLNSGADPNLTSHNGCTALHGAALSLNMVDLFLMIMRWTFENMMQRDVTLDGVILNVCQMMESHNFVEIYNEALKQYPLYQAEMAAQGLHRLDSFQMNIAQLLLDRGIDVTAKNSHGQTALHNAAITGHDTILRLLLNKGADPTVRDNKGLTALDYAIWHGYKAVIRILRRYSHTFPRRRISEHWNSLSIK